MLLSERQNYAETMFKLHPELFPEARRDAIRKGVVIVGMAPFEARLAGGAFAYKVIADKAKWPDGIDPLKVMWAQSMQADDSEIWMIFRNDTQFSEGNDVSFKVHFEKGCAVSVERMGC